ncbi:MAG: SGNH/GDSL hydrolase family protein [Lachnospiraceae bacterium]|nr:SGNH/GDSL hydrolase family protein [Lachnospiraceae bacterium]
MKRSNRKPFTAAVLLLSVLGLSGCTAAATVPDADVYINEDTLAQAASTETAAASASVSTGALFESTDRNTDPAPIVVKGLAGTGSSEAAAVAASSASVARTAGNAEDQPDDGKDHLEILFLGDSQFSNARGSGTEIPEVVRGYLGEGAEDCRIYNLGIEGSCAALKRSERDMKLDQWTSTSFLGMAHLLKGDVSPAFLEKQYPDIAATFKKIKKDQLDFIVIDYGVNDFLSATEIYAEDDPYDPADFSFAYQKGLQLLNEACPQATILCCTPCYAQFFAKDGAYLGDGNTLNNGYDCLSGYVGAVDYAYKEAENTILVDMYHGTRMDLDSYSADGYLSDGIHLTAQGRTAYGVVVARMINKQRGLFTDDWSIIRIGVAY